MRGKKKKLYKLKKGKGGLSGKGILATGLPVKGGKKRMKGKMSRDCNAGECRGPLARKGGGSGGEIAGGLANHRAPFGATNGVGGRLRKKEKASGG